MDWWKTAVMTIGIGLTLAACGGAVASGGNGTADQSGCTVKGASTATPTLTSNVIPDPNALGRFVPNNMTVKVGQAIEWNWQDPSVPHSVTSDDGTTFDSCLQNEGYKFIVTFTQAGSIPYRCTIHPSMVGTITVTQ